MTDKPEHPDGSQSEQDQGLEAQLDDLISQLEAVDPESVPADLRHQPAAPPQPEPSKPESEPEPVASDISDPEAAEASVEEAEAEQAEATPASMDADSIESMASNMLDKQIQNTIESASDAIDDGPTQPEVANQAAEVGVSGGSGDSGGDDLSGSADAIESPGEASETEEATTSDEYGELGNQLDALFETMKTKMDQPDTSDEQAEGGPEPVGAESGDAGDPQDAVGVSIDQIDAMLAESAERAIEQESDTTPVPGTDEILAAQAEAEAKAAAESQAKPVEPLVKPEPMPVPAPVEKQTDAQPEQTEAQPAKSFGANAQDVAQELNQDEQAQPIGAEAGEAVGSGEDEVFGEQDIESPEVIVNQGALRRAERRLFHLCATINKPLNRFSDETRNTVGYVGVLTTAIALFLALYGLLS